MSLAKRIAERWFAGAGSRVLYHIGPRPPRPVPKSVSKRLFNLNPTNESWIRSWLDDPLREAVFLTPNPIPVYVYHGKRGNLYAFRVPEWVIKESKGLHRYDRATEILIPGPLWKHVKFVGKKMDAKELDAYVERMRDRPAE